MKRILTCDTGGTATDVWVWPAGTELCPRWWFSRWTEAASWWPNANRSRAAVFGTRTTPDSSPPWRTAGSTSVCPPDTPTWQVRPRSPPGPPCLHEHNNQYYRCGRHWRVTLRYEWIRINTRRVVKNILFYVPSRIFKKLATLRTMNKRCN